MESYVKLYKNTIQEEFLKMGIIFTVRIFHIPADNSFHLFLRQVSMWHFYNSFSLKLRDLRQ